MAQNNAALRPNNTLVLDAVEWLLKQISPANSTSAHPFITDGVVVDRRRDPRKVYQDLHKDVIKTGSFIRIKEGPGKVLTGAKGYVGNAYRWVAGIDLICWSVMTAEQDAAEITSDQLMGWLRDDIDSALSDDDDGTTCIMRAAAALVQQEGPWGEPGTWGPAPSCQDIHITGWLDGPVQTFPWTMSVVQLQYTFDKHGSARVPGLPS